MDISKQQIQAWLQMMPPTPENMPVIQTLQNLMQSPDIVKDTFTYSTSFSNANLTAGNTVTNNLAIQADADFIILAQTFEADVAAAGQTFSSATYPLVNVLLTDTGSGRQLMNQAVPVPSIFGNGQFPFVLPQPKKLDARSNLAVAVTNRDAAQAYNLTLNFIGAKLFKLS